MVKLDHFLSQKIDSYFAKCKDLADYITDHPELGCEEAKAVEAYRNLFQAEGFEFKSPYKGVANSFKAVKKGSSKDSRPHAVLLCEYDALPEVGHACGHSISGSSSALAALAIHSAYPDLPICIDVIGTPGEEYPGGKEMLLKENAFDGYEFAAMAHMFSANSSGFYVLACNDRYITFRGKSAHASGCPQDGINALNAARLYMDAMDMWRQHLPKFAQFHGIICDGGALPSIVPENIELNYYFRAANLLELDRVCEISENCCKAAAIATGCTYTAIQQYLTYADLSNLPLNIEAVNDIFDAMGETYTYSADPQGSTDAGNVDYALPVFHPMVKISGAESIPIHNPAFQKLMKSEGGYKGLRNAATLLANLIFELANNPERLENIKQEHRKYRNI